MPCGVKGHEMKEKQFVSCPQ